MKKIRHHNRSGIIHTESLESEELSLFGDTVEAAVDFNVNMFDAAANGSH